MNQNLLEARAEAEGILKLDQGQVSALFFQQTMQRHLSRTVRHLDKLFEAGGVDGKLGKMALRRIGFDPDA